MPNMGRNPSANSMGVLNRIDPPHKEMKKAERIMTDGIDIIIVVVWKNAVIVVPIPVINMWCAQTMKDMKPRKITEKTMERYPQRGFRVLFAIISATIPIAGSIST
jgi:hypothetical protein